MYDDVAWSITIEIPDDPAIYGKTICLDSVADTMEYWPWSTWVWSTLTESYTPTWDGPHCFTISCCRLGGDADHSGAVNVADITYLVDYLFFDGPPPPCPEEGDANGNGSINSADPTYLNDYIFFQGPAPLPCP